MSPETQMATTPIRKRPSFFKRKYLIDRPLQLKLILFFIFLSIGNLSLFYVLARMTLQNVMFHLPTFDPTAQLMTLNSLEESERWLLRAFVVFGIISFLYSVISGLLLSHTIAGPLFACHRFVKKLIQSEDPGELRLRKTDFMIEFAQDLNQIREKLRPHLTRPAPEAESKTDSEPQM